MRSEILSLEGNWQVQRTGGLLPPMPGVQKRISGGRGATWVGPLPALPFRLEQREGYITLLYLLPGQLLVDELQAGEDGSWLGRTILGGQEIGRFRMTRKSSSPAKAARF